jgi:regulator of cell morphogenesis and NO signaling
MLEQNTLDVTVLEPRQKHPTIFARFDELAEGESLTIFNDHDPKPLYYELLGERGDIFSWEYLEEGPQWWRVRMTIRSQGDETLGQIAAKDLRKAQVFKKYGLDFCCGGKKTVRKACAEKGLDATRVERELQQVAGPTEGRPIPYDEWEPGFLADYIVNTHHSYIRKTLPDLRAYSEKVLRVHGGRHPELGAISELVVKIQNELTEHMEKEEKIVFPFIKARAEAGGPIHVMELEHEAVGEEMATIRKLTKDYTLPQDACASYSLLYRMLEDFEEDLHVHVHLENNILFPKGLAGK